MPASRTCRAGDSIEDFCRACKIDRLHTVVAADGQGQPIRVVCGYCQSEHHYRGGPRVEPSGSSGGPRVPPGVAKEPASGPGAPPCRRPEAAPAPFPIVSDRERTRPAMTVPHDTSAISRCCCGGSSARRAGITPVVPAEKWRGGSLVLRPGTPGLQEKSWPIETFFHKVVMLRNRLRTLEQHVNASEPPRRREGEAAGLHQRLLRVADELQRAVRGRGRSVQGSGGD